MFNLDNALQHMGKVWFLSYFLHCHNLFDDSAYYDVSDFYIRKLYYDATPERHFDYLKSCLNSSPKSLAKNNKMRLTEDEIKHYFQLARTYLSTVICN